MLGLARPKRTKKPEGRSRLHVGSRLFMKRLVHVRSPDIWRFPKSGVPFLGVPIIRIIICWGLYWGPPILGNYHMGGCQNFGPFLGTLHIRCRIILGIQRGTRILTTTHMDSRKGVRILGNSSKPAATSTRAEGSASLNSDSPANKHGSS